MVGTEDYGVKGPGFKSRRGQNFSEKGWFGSTLQVVNCVANMNRLALLQSTFASQSSLFNSPPPCSWIALLLAISLRFVKVKEKNRPSFEPLTLGRPFC